MRLRLPLGLAGIALCLLILHLSSRHTEFSTNSSHNRTALAITDTKSFSIAMNFLTSSLARSQLFPLNKFAFQLLFGETSAAASSIPGATIARIRRIAYRAGTIATLTTASHSSALNKSLTNIRTFGGTVFQPLSGPDILGTLMLFPKASRYSIIAAEPLGLSEDFSRWGLERKLAASKLVDTLLGEFEQLGHILPDEQRPTPLFNSEVGVIPFLICSIYLAGYNIVDCSSKPESGEAVLYFKDSANNLKSLYYFHQPRSINMPFDLSQIRSHPSLSETSLAAHLRTAQYELFSTANADLLRFLQTKCEIVLQDDSGWPFDQLTQHFKHVSLIGSYTGPAKLARQNLDVVSRLFQRSLWNAIPPSSTQVNLISPITYQYHWHLGRRAEVVDSKADMKGQLLIIASSK